MSTDTLAILLVGLIVSVTGFLAMGGLILLASRDTTKIPELIARTTNIEKMLEHLSADVGVEMAGGAVREVWRSADGKYEASSFEELLTKMTNDPNSPLTADEIESIKSIFDKILGESDDPEKEDWQK